MKRIFVVGNASKAACASVLMDLGKSLEGRAEVVGTSLQKATRLPEEPLDLVISLGGDGSYLNLVEEVIDRNIPIMGINFGNLGFLTAGLANELEKLIDAYLDGDTMVYERMVLRLRIQKQEGWTQHIALNDVLVSAPDLTRVVSLRVGVSEEPLFHFRGDGIIISTPTGSTAHSLSAGGSLVDPRVEAILMTPLNSQSMSSRPMVVRPGAQIEVGVHRKGHEAMVTFDGKKAGMVGAGERVLIERHAQPFLMVQSKDFTFFDRLANRLGWRETLQ